MYVCSMCTPLSSLLHLIFFTYSPTSMTQATPARTHFAFGCLDRICAEKIKVGPRNSVLYVGAEKTPAVSSSVDKMALHTTMGMFENNSFGLLSAINNDGVSNLAPCM